MGQTSNPLAVATKTSILFIGNSFTNRNDLPGLLTQLAAAATPARSLQTSRVIANGMSLKTHWDRGEARKAIRSSDWDYVVLQEQSTLPLKNRQKMHEYVRLFDGEITSHGAKTVLYLTWARLDTFQRQDELSDAYLSIGRELGAIVVPVGVAWQRVLSEHPQITLHDRDKSHPNPTGSYLAACVFFASLFHRSPLGLPTDAIGGQSIDVERAKLLQDAAWRVVQVLPTGPAGPTVPRPRSPE